MEITTKELLELNIKALVDIPEKVVVEEFINNYVIVYRLSVDQSDIGKVIGKHGRIAKAIRTILSASSSKSGKRVVLEILD